MKSDSYVMTVEIESRDKLKIFNWENSNPRIWSHQI